MSSTTPPDSSAPGHVPRRVEAYIDPMCPFAYQTSLWLREIRDTTGLEVAWRFFSLEEINREPHQRHPWERDWAWGFGQMRVGAYLRRRSQADVDAWYAGVGKAFFADERPTFDPGEHRKLMDELGFGAGVVDDALGDPSTADEVRDEHLGVVADHGAHGVPTLVFDTGSVIFGPVVAPAPTGDAAQALWEVVCRWGDVPYLYEMRTPKTAADLSHLGEQFAPYLRARAWQSMARPAP